MRRFAAAALLLSGALGMAATPVRADDQAVLARLSEAAATVTTISSEFIQEKHLALFRETLVSRGHFAFAKPDRLRWEMLEPVKTGFVLRGKEGRRWNERTGQSEPFNLDRDPLMRVVAGQIMAWASADFQTLRREYRIILTQADPPVLTLTPLSAGAGAFVDHLVISFAAGGKYVDSVDVREKGGDFTLIRFIGARLNDPLPADAF